MTFQHFTYLYSCYICIRFSIVQRFEHFSVIALYKLNIIIMLYVGDDKIRLILSLPTRCQELVSAANSLATHEASLLIHAIQSTAT